jgi:hypothetical protein
LTVVRALVVVMTVGVVMGSMPGCTDDPPGEEPSAAPASPAEPAELAEPAEPARGEAAGPADAADPAVVAAAVEATRAVPSARVELQTAYRGLEGGGSGSAGSASNGGTSARLVQRAAFDRRSKRAEAEMDMSELAAVLDDADEAIPGDYSRPTRVVVADGTVYSQIGPIAAEVGLDPATWVTRDVASLADRPVENDTMALLVQPLGMLDLLQLPIESVRVVGEDEVRGARTVHLAATVDLAGGGGSGGGSGGGAELGTAPDQTGGPPFDEAIDARLRRLGLTELPVDLWLGGDHVVRRVAFSIDSSDASGGLTTTFDVYDVGEPIEVDVPEGPDVIDQDELRSRVLDR